MTLHDIIVHADAADDELNALLEIGQTLSKSKVVENKALGKCIAHLTSIALEHCNRQFKLTREYFIAHEPPGTIRTV